MIFVVYLVCMVGVGVFFFFKHKDGDDKGYLLGGREMHPVVAGLSAGASDMSAWVLMGLPAAIYGLGTGQVWIPVGLAIGYALSWIFEAPRLRKFSVVAKDSITIPQFLDNRFLSQKRVLQVVCAIIFLIAYTIYAASSIKACGTLFNKVLGIDAQVAMYIAAVVIILYVFLGGFNAVCWTDFFQGLLMLAAMLLAPIFALFALNSATIHPVDQAGFWNPFSSWQDVVSGLAWGIGYFGMPHIIIRFMSVRSTREIKKSATVGITWTVIIVIAAAAIGIVGRLFLGYDDGIYGTETVFVEMCRALFPGVISGIVLAAILAAAMSTADSQLLASASALAADVYKPFIRKDKCSNKEILWVSRIVVVLISIVAVLVASAPGAGSIMSLVSNAWGIFGAAFGPCIMLSLFWKRFNHAGCTAGIITGAAVDILWLAFCSSTGIYEILPGAVAGLVVAIIVTKCTPAPSKEVEELYETALTYED